MGTVGLNFGSATSGTGFDVTTTVNSILAIQQGIETPWKTQLTALQAQDTVFSTLGTDLSTLTTSLQSLTDASGALAEKEGSSSDTSILTLTSASTAAVAGSHTVVVNSLAATSSKYSAPIANASDTLSGTLTIAVGSGSAQTITIGSTNDTLTTLSAAINAADVGVTASVITDANGSRLSLVSGTSGASGDITLGGTLTDATTSSTVGFSTGQTGANASLTVDGVAISSPSNTVTGAIPGVTFQLLSQSPATNVQVQVTNDNAAVETAVNTLVTSYNAVIKDINTQEGKDSTGAAEPLFGSTTLSQIQTELQSALYSGTASGGISSITQLGLSVGTDGTLTLDTSALDATLNSNFAGVTGYLQNTGSFGQNLAKILNNLGSLAPNGAIYLAQQQNASEEAALNKSVANEETLIATERTNLTAELNTANQILQSIPQQLDQINEIYSAVTGYNQNLNG
jgi:flagellar hook-associated protein 2